MVEWLITHIIRCWEALTTMFVFRRQQRHLVFARCNDRVAS